MTSSSNSIQPTPCVVVHAGPSVLLAIEVRPGRFPVRITSAQEHRFEWVANDGRVEAIALEGPNAASDHRRLYSELLQGELLVAEVNDPMGFDDEEASYQLVSLNPPAVSAVERPA